MHTIIRASLALSILLYMAGCNSSTTLPIGENVVIQFDRASLGSGASLPVSPTTESINGEETAIRGNLIAINEEWIQVRVSTLQNNGTLIKDIWIPKKKILLIQRSIFQGK